MKAFLAFLLITSAALAQTPPLGNPAISTPTVSGQAATKGYVDNLLSNGNLPASAINGISTTSTIVTVCAAGCNYTNPLTAWSAARAMLAYGPYVTYTIQISDGTYTMSNGFYTEEPTTRAIRIIGNVADSSKVVLNFNNIAGNNGSAFAALNGGQIGSATSPGVDGVTINGVGAKTSTSTWIDQSYGAGAFALGSGSNIHFGQHVVINNFYYSALADEGGHFASDGGRFNGAGDVNVLARHGGVVHCLGCYAVGASHIFTDPQGNSETLGFNFMAEAGGAAYVDGSTGINAQVACFASQTAASMWAHDVVAANCLASAVRVSQNGFAELTRAKLRNSAQGVLVQSNGAVSVDATEIYSNTFDGLHVVGGHAYGNGLRAHDNGSYGIKLEKAASAELYGALVGSTANGAGVLFNETGTPCTTLNGACNPPSFLVIN